MKVSTWSDFGLNSYTRGKPEREIRLECGRFNPQTKIKHLKRRSPRQGTVRYYLPTTYYLPTYLSSSYGTTYLGSMKRNNYTIIKAR